MLVLVHFIDLNDSLGDDGLMNVRLWKDHPMWPKYIYCHLIDTSFTGYPTDPPPPLPPSLPVSG
jgi:hypothetical protein